MIRYLRQEEKSRTRAMYQENFPEDSQAFVDYYFTDKTKDNQILVMEEDTVLQVMIHLNPFLFQICGETATINYVVAVATEASVRRQGRMARVLERALRDMAGKHQPFTFLIPANARVYQSAGFVFVSVEQYPEYEMQLADHPEPADHMGTAARQIWDLEAAQLPTGQIQDLEADQLSVGGTQNLGAAQMSAGGAQGLEAAQLSGTGEQISAEFLAGMESAERGDVRLRRAHETDFAAMAEFANRFLVKRYDIYPNRTSAYYERMQRELACQNGGLVLMECHGMDQETGEGRGGAQQYSQEQRKSALVGIFSYNLEESAELQEILVLPGYRRQFIQLAKDWLQKLQEFQKEEGLSCSIPRMEFMVRILDLQTLGLMLRSREPFILKVQVRDNIIPANRGSFEIRADREGSSIRCISPKETDRTMEIGELAEFLFRRMRIFIREWV